MRLLVIAALASLTIAIAERAIAHHSAAPFDFSKPITIDGVVREFNVVNPHTHAIITVKDQRGSRDVEYEGHSASNFYRAGYTTNSVKAGDQIAILIAPRKDGGDGGFILSFRANGQTAIGFGDLSPSTGKPVQSTNSEGKP